MRDPLDEVMRGSGQPVARLPCRHRACVTWDIELHELLDLSSKVVLVRASPCALPRKSRDTVDRGVLNLTRADSPFKHAADCMGNGDVGFPCLASPNTILVLCDLAHDHGLVSRARALCPQVRRSRKEKQHQTNE